MKRQNTVFPVKFMLLALIALVLAGCSGTWQPAPVKVINLKLYENPIFGISLQYPANWQPSDDYGLIKGIPQRYHYFNLHANKDHIRDLARSLRFDPAPAAGAGQIAFIFRYGVGAGNELNTFKGKYTKDMIVDPPVTVNLSLSGEELESIYKKMMEIDFFSYPDRFKASPPPGEGLHLVTPHSSYYFLVSHNSRIKELWWDDQIVNANEKAGRLRELIEYIRGIVESKEEYKKLPPPRGGYA
ncbi:MAG: hypothetical protein ACOY40_08315 [Bacillota bacterium]